MSSAREAELRQLRKSNMEFEERNAALQKHVESMRTAVEKLEVDVIQERSRNTVLQQHLETLRQMLTSSFASMPLPGNVILSEVSGRESGEDGDGVLFTLVLMWRSRSVSQEEKRRGKKNPVKIFSAVWACLKSQHSGGRGRKISVSSRPACPT